MQLANDPHGRRHPDPAPSCTSRWRAAAHRCWSKASIAPGAKLNERELSEQLQVSRTPLREAIKLLAAEGLVELLPNRGAVAVAARPRPTWSNTFEVIAALEGHVGRTGGAAHHRRRAGRDPRAALRDDGRPSRAATCRATTASTRRSTPRSTPRPRNPVLTQHLRARSTRACRRCAFAPTRTRPSGSAR